MKPKNTRRLVFPALILAGSLAAPLAQAASQIWDGGSAVNGNWSTLLNWVGDTAAPGATSGTTNTDVATFNAAIANTWGNAVGNPIVIDSTTQNLGGISFGGATGNYFIGTTAGNSLLLSSGGSIQILNTLTATNAIETINAPLVIQGGGGTYTFSNNSTNGVGAGAGTLNFGGGITGGAAGATVLTLSGSNTNANTISGIIGNGSATTMAVTKSGAGTWVLSGGNSYTGATLINAGVLNIQHATALGGTAGSTTVASGAALQLQGGITVGAEALSLNGSGLVVTGALRNISGANTWQGTVTLASATRINSDSGSLTLNAANSITGGQNLNLGGAGNGTVGGTITTGNGTLTKDGAGTWTLSGTNTYTGQTTVGLGVLRLDSATALGSGNLNINGVGNGGTFYGIIGLGGAGANNFTRSLNSTAGTVQFSNHGGWAAFDADRIVNLGGAGATVTWATGTTGFNGKNLALGTATATHTVDLQNAIDMTNGGRTVFVDNGAAAIDAKMSGNITGVGGGNLTKSGAGTLVLSGTNNYAGTTTVAGGVLRVNGTNSGTGAVSVSSGAALGGTGSLAAAVTVATGAAIDLRDGVTGNLTLGSTLTFSGTTAAPNNLYFDLAAGSSVTDKIVTTGAVTAAGGASGVLVNFNQLPGTYTPATGVILIQPTAVSTYANYTLATTRSGGNVYSNLAASGNNLVVDIATAAAGPAAAFWAGGANPWTTAANWTTDVSGGTPLGSIPGVGTNVTFGTTTPIGNLTTNTVDDDFEINSLTFNDLAGGVTIGGTKMLTIDATNANGNTLGNGITSSNTSGTNTISTKIGLGGNQTWTTASGGTLAVSGVVSDFGGGYSLTKAGPGTLTLSAVNSITGPITISAGELQIGGAGSLLAGSSYAGNITNNGTLRYNSSVNNYTFSGLISGTGAFIKDGSARIILTGINTYSGGTIINGGIVDMDTGNTFAFGSGPITVNTTGQLTLQRVGNNSVAMINPLILNGGTLSGDNGSGDTLSGPVTLASTSIINTNSNGQITIAGNITGPGGLTKNGSNTTSFLNLSGTNNYTGTTTLNAGIIRLSAPEIAGTSGPLGTPTTPAGSIVMNGGFLQYSAFNNGAPVVNVFDYSSRFSTVASQKYNVDTNSISQGVVWGANLTSSGGTLTKSGLGTLYLTGANTYDGVTTIANGALGVKSLNFITTGTLGGGASPAASSSLGRPTSAPNGTIAIGSSGNTGKLFYSGAGETTDRVINLAGSTGGAIIEQAGTGTLKFTNPQTATVAGTKTLTLTGSTAGTGEFAGAIVNGSGTTGLTKSGSGLWTLSGVNLYTGATTVGGGTLTLNRKTGSLTATALTFGNLTGVGGGGTFNMDNVGASSALTQTLGALTFSAGDGRVMTTRTAAFDQTITFASLAARTAGATGNFVNTGTNSATNGFAFTAAPATGTQLDRGLFYNGSSYASYDTGGFIRGYTTGDANYLSVAGGSTMGTPATTDNVALTGNITAQTTTTVNTINMGANNLTMSAAGQVLSSNGILSSGSSTATLGIGTKDSILEATAAGNELVVRVDGSSDQLTLNSIIRNQAGGGTASRLTKTGAGALTLTGTNTFTGGTYVNSGTLNINSIGALNSATTTDAVAVGGQGSLLLNDGTTLSNTSGTALTFVSGAYADHSSDATNKRVAISLNGSVTFDGAADGSKNMFFSRMGDNNVSTVTLLSDSTVNVTNGVFNIGTKMAGAFSLTKNGVGELQVGNTNNTLAFTGGLFLNEGTFTGSSPQFAFGNGMVFLGDLKSGSTKSATLVYSSENQANNNNVLTRDSITVNAGSSGNLAFVTRNTNGSGVNGISGSVILNNSLTLAATAASTSTQLSGVVSGTGGLRIGDTTNTNLGTVLLSGANTYTGGTIVNTGTLTGTGTSPLGATTGTLAVNNPNTGAGTAVVLNLSTTAATTTGSLSGTIATPSGGTNTATINNGGQALTVNQTSAGTYAGVIAGNGSLTLGASSTNTLTLSGTNTYTGATTVSAGKLAVNGSTASGSAFTVQTGGTLGGSGSIGGTVAVNSGGHFAPGNSISSSFATGALTLASGSFTDIELGTAGASHAAPGTSDRTAVSGGLVLGGTLTVINNAGADGNGSIGGGSYKIFTQTGTPTGSFSSVVNVAGYHAKVDTATSGSVYLDNYALATTGTVAAVDLGKARVGGTFSNSGALSVSNASAANNGYTEGLNATQGAVSGGVIAGGTNISNLAGASSSTSLTAGFSTATSGAKSGSSTIDFASSGTNSGYTDTALTSQAVGVTGSVYDYATAVFSQASGAGTFTGSGTSYTLDFGAGLALNTNYTATIQLANGVLFNAFQDALGGSYTGSGASEFTQTAATFSNLTSNGNNTFTVTFNSGTSGTFNGSLDFAGLSQQSGLSDASLSNVNIAFTGIAAVPEPDVAMLVGGLGMLALLRRRRNA